MISLRHGVNLSRRACRVAVLACLLLLMAGVATGAAKPPNHAADSLMHPQPDVDNAPRDINVLLQVICDVWAHVSVVKESTCFNASLGVGLKPKKSCQFVCRLCYGFRRFLTYT